MQVVTLIATANNAVIVFFNDAVFVQGDIHRHRHGVIVARRYVKNRVR
ncbi:hypothetical protein ABZZ76_002850 [Salmonella enterica]